MFFSFSINVAIVSFSVIVKPFFTPFTVTAMLPAVTPMCFKYDASVAVAVTVVVVIVL